MASESETPYQKKCEILSDFWMNYKEEEEFEDFVEYNDIGLSLSFCITEEIVASTSVAQLYIEESWELLCAALKIDADLSYNSIEDMFQEAGA